MISACWSTLHIPRLTKSVVATLRELAQDEDADTGAIVEFTRRQLRHRDSDLSDDTRTELVAICELLNGHDFPSRLRRFVKYVSWEDYHDDDANDTRLVDDQLDDLASAVTENPALLIPELDWLVCEESSPAYGFGFRVGSNDSKRGLLARILDVQAAAGDSGKTSFLAGYLRSVFEQNVGEWESILEGIAVTPATAGMFSDFVVSSGMTTRIALAVVHQCRQGAQSKEKLSRWWFDSQLESLEEDVLRQLLSVQLEDGIGTHWSNAVHMCHTYYIGRDGEPKSLPESLTFVLLTSDAMADGHVLHNTAYYWSRLADEFLRQFPERRWELFERVLIVAFKGWAVLSALDKNEERVLTTLVKDNPESAWNCIARAYDSAGDNRTFGLQRWLRSRGLRTIGDEAAGPIQHVPSTVLFEWVDEDRDDRAYWLTQVLPKTLDESAAGRLTRDFVARFGRAESVRSSLLVQFESGAWHGKASDHYRGLRDDARSWLVNERNSTVRRWIEDYIERLGLDIDRSIIEEERGR